jgi:hypothetical protein
LWSGTGFSRFGVHVLFARHGWIPFPPADGVGMLGSPGVSVGVRWSYFESESGEV